MSEAGIEIQILCIGLLVLGSYFMGKLARHLKIGETTGQLVGGLLVREEQNRESLRRAADAQGVLEVLRKAAPA